MQVPMDVMKIPILLVDFPQALNSVSRPLVAFSRTDWYPLSRVDRLKIAAVPCRAERGRAVERNWSGRVEESVWKGGT